jgi:uncharacterized protein YcaQ
MLEEDFLVNYGFLPRAHSELMHPRTARHAWTRRRQRRPTRCWRLSESAVRCIRGRSTAICAWQVTNWFGGSSNATTRLLDEMHYRGLLRVARREGGTRVYAAREFRGDRRRMTRRSLQGWTRSSTSW